MFAEKIYMRKYFEIDSKEFPSKLVDLAYEEARAALRNDFDAIAKTQQQVQTFLGWYLAAIVSLIGILVGTLASQEGSLLVMLMTAYGIVALSVPAAQMWFGVLYNVTVYPEGGEPSVLLSEEALDWLDGYPKGEQAHFRKLAYLVDLDERHKKNTELRRRMCSAYRVGLTMTLAGIALGLVLLIGLCIFIF